MTYDRYSHQWNGSTTSTGSR